jgi:hypothetical protein
MGRAPKGLLIRRRVVQIVITRRPKADAAIQKPDVPWIASLTLAMTTQMQFSLQHDRVLTPVHG